MDVSSLSEAAAPSTNDAAPKEEPKHESKVDLLAAYKYIKIIDNEDTLTIDLSNFEKDKEGPSPSEVETTKDHLFVFELEGVLAVPDTTPPRPYLIVKSMIEAAAKVAHLAVISQEPHVKEVLQGWGVWHHVSAIRAGSNEPWEDGAYDESLKKHVLRCDQIRSILTNELKDHSLVGAVFFGDDRYIDEGEYESLPMAVKLVPQNRFFGINDTDIYKICSAYDREGEHSSDELKFRIKELLCCFEEENEELFTKKEMYEAFYLMVLTLMGKVLAQDDKIKQFSFNLRLARVMYCMRFPDKSVPGEEPKTDGDSPMNDEKQSKNTEEEVA